MSETSKQTSDLAKAAFADNTISDFRKESRTFPLAANGLTYADAEEFYAAIAADYCMDKIDRDRAAVFFKSMDGIVGIQDQAIKREQMALQADLRSRRIKGLNAKRRAMMS